LFWGSSQSKEADEQIEAKLDHLLRERGIDPAEVSREVNETLWTRGRRLPLDSRPWVG
jgi:hypothetical protein